MLLRDLGILAYRDAWAVQEAAHAAVLAGGEEQLLLVEHPPTVTLGRRPGLGGDVRAAADALAAMNVEVVETDRGGQVTFHGPGQLVAYPIVRLADHKLSVGGYVHGLEQAIIDAVATWGIRAARDPKAVGVWVEEPERAPTIDAASPPSFAARSVSRERSERDASNPEKLAAIGVRVRRGVALHGLALNVTTDLRYFDLIVPCGMPDRRPTSLAKLLGDDAPPMDEVKRAVAGAVGRWLESRAE